MLIGLLLLFLFESSLMLLFLKGSWTILALTCNWNTWAMLQSTSCFWMRHVGLLHLERCLEGVDGSWLEISNITLFMGKMVLGRILFLSLSLTLSQSHSHTSQLYYGLTVSVSVLSFPSEMISCEFILMQLAGELWLSRIHQKKNKNK